MLRNPIDDIGDIEEPITWQNFASSTEGILNLFKNSNLNMDDFRVADPSKIPIDESLFVSVFLFNILENPLVNEHSVSVFSEPDKHYSYSENVLQFIITVHSTEHLLGINAIEKLMGIVYATPSIHVSKEIKQLHLRVNLKDNPIEVWDKLFPSTPYRLSFLLTVHGPGVTYQTPEAYIPHSVTSYDSSEEPEELFTV